MKKMMDLSDEKSYFLSVSKNLLFDKYAVT